LKKKKEKKTPSLRDTRHGNSKLLDDVPPGVHDPILVHCKGSSKDYLDLVANDTSVARILSYSVKHKALLLTDSSVQFFNRLTMHVPINVYITKVFIPLGRLPKHDWG